MVLSRKNAVPSEEVNCMRNTTSAAGIEDMDADRIKGIAVIRFQHLTVRRQTDLVIEIRLVDHAAIRTLADKHRTVFTRMCMGFGLIERTRLRGVRGIVCNGLLILKIINQQHILIFFRSRRQHCTANTQRQQDRSRTRSRQ